ncbi:hypothetical protein LCGC14_0890280, partial [marine sediment metagenome]
GIATSGGFVVTNSISNVSGGSTTFTITSGANSALDGMNAAHINGRPVTQYT